MASRKEGSMIGPYRVIEQIGRGGMATIYKAFQPSVERYVALKILPAHFAEDPLFVQRFTQEARTIARLEHRNILPIIDFGEDNGITYLAMRFLEGGTLKDVLAQGNLTMHDISDIMSQVCSALDYAHRKGVVHRDVKPANIMVDTEGAIYLTDFGIAKVLEGAENLTETGAAIGTPAYMAPEQSLGKSIDGRIDIYALGVILYEMVTGRPPFQADTPMAVALAHIHEPLPLPRLLDPTIPEPIEAVIIKALAKAADDRYATANEFAEALERAVSEAGQIAEDSTLQVLLQDAITMDVPRSEAVVPAEVTEDDYLTEPAAVVESEEQYLTEPTEIVEAGEPEVITKSAAPTADIRGGEPTRQAARRPPSPSMIL